MDKNEEEREVLLFGLGIHSSYRYGELESRYHTERKAVSFRLLGCEAELNAHRGWLQAISDSYV